MESTHLALRDVVLFSGEAHVDERGSFSHAVDVGQLAGLGLDTTTSYLATAHNRRRGTLRGLHYQRAPHEESKTLWCVSGSLYDVLVDVRPDEPTYGTWIAVELTADPPTTLHVPPGVAHGYQTTSDDTSVCYAISAPYAPESARGLNPRDAVLGIPWPLPVSAISRRDAEAPAWPPA